MVLALARRLHHRSLHLTTPDLFRYSTLQPDDAMRGLGFDPAAFVVYADAPAGARQVLAGESWVVETVVKHREGFQLLHVSDQNASPVPYVVFLCVFGCGWVGVRAALRPYP